jgi:hypothetical protein
MAQTHPQFSFDSSHQQGQWYTFDIPQDYARKVPLYGGCSDVVMFPHVPPPPPLEIVGVAPCGDESLCLNVSQCVSKCLKVSQCVSMCLNVSQVVSKCLKVSQSVSKCLKVSQSVSGGGTLVISLCM